MSLEINTAASASAKHGELVPDQRPQRGSESRKAALLGSVFTSAVHDSTPPRCVLCCCGCVSVCGRSAGPRARRCPHPRFVGLFIVFFVTSSLCGGAASVCTYFLCVDLLSVFVVDEDDVGISESSVHLFVLIFKLHRDVFVSAQDLFFCGSCVAAWRPFPVVSHSAAVRSLN